VGVVGLVASVGVRVLRGTGAKAARGPRGSTAGSPARGRHAGTKMTLGGVRSAAAARCARLLETLAPGVRPSLRASDPPSEHRHDATNRCSQDAIAARAKHGRRRQAAWCSTVRVHRWRRRRRHGGCAPLTARLRVVDTRKGEEGASCTCSTRADAPPARGLRPRICPRWHASSNDRLERRHAHMRMHLLHCGSVLRTRHGGQIAADKAGSTSTRRRDRRERSGRGERVVAAITGAIDVDHRRGARRSPNSYAAVRSAPRGADASPARDPAWTCSLRRPHVAARADRAGRSRVEETNKALVGLHEHRITMAPLRRKTSG